MTDRVIQHQEASRPKISPQEWAEATDGRMQCLKVTRTGSPYTWKFVGVNQHVARSTNRKARSLMRSTLHALVSAAQAENHQVAILGDFNAAPIEGRWVYFRWSASVKEDLIMNEWAQTSGLTEVLQHGKSTPTWRLNQGPEKVMLDRVYVTPDTCPLPELSVQWHSPDIIFDHAVLLFRIQHSLIGTGYAGACRPDREAFPRSSCQVNLGKWRRHISELSETVSTKLRQLKEEHKNNPPAISDPASDICLYFLYIYTHTDCYICLYFYLNIHIYIR